MNLCMENINRIIVHTNRNRELGITRYECAVAALGLLTNGPGLNYLQCLQTEINSRLQSIGISTMVDMPIPESVNYVYPGIMKTIQDIGLKVGRVEINPVIGSCSDIRVPSGGLLLHQSKSSFDGAEEMHLVAIKSVDVLPRDLRRKQKRGGYDLIIADTETPVTVGVISRVNLREYINERSRRRDIGLFVVELIPR